MKNKSRLLTTVKYGLMQPNGQLVQCTNDSMIEIDKYGYEDWLVDDLDTVYNLLDKVNATADGTYNPGWYNADIDNPIVSIDIRQAQPIQVTYTTEYTLLKR